MGIVGLHRGHAEDSGHQTHDTAESFVGGDACNPHEVQDQHVVHRLHQNARPGGHVSHQIGRPREIQCTRANEGCQRCACVIVKNRHRNLGEPDVDAQRLLPQVDSPHRQHGGTPHQRLHLAHRGRDPNAGRTGLDHHVFGPFPAVFHFPQKVAKRSKGNSQAKTWDVAERAPHLLWMLPEIRTRVSEGKLQVNHRGTAAYPKGKGQKSQLWVETSQARGYGSALMSTWQLAGLTIHLRGGTDGRGGGDGPLVLLLHGYGAQGNDLVGLARELHVAGSVRFAFPEAPLVVPDGSDPSAPGRAWWDINMAKLQMGLLVGDYAELDHQLSAGLDESLPRMSALLEAIFTDMRVSPHRMVIGGFSQGAVLALHTALAMEARPAGVLVLSGTRVRFDAVRTQAARFPGLHAVVSHGEFDPILPFALGGQLSQDLQEAGWQVDWASFRGGHGIGWEALRAAERLITRALGE